MNELKIKRSEGINFFENVYKNLYSENYYKEENIQLKSDIDKIINENDRFGLRQLEYYPLAMDFFEIAKSKKISAESLVKYLGVDSEIWSAWVSSYNKGNIKTPVSFQNEVIYKMSSFVLKDKVQDYLNNNKEEENIISKVIEIEKNKKRGLLETNNNLDKIEKPLRKNIIKP